MRPEFATQKIAGLAHRARRAENEDHENRWTSAQQTESVASLTLRENTDARFDVDRIAGRLTQVDRVTSSRVRIEGKQQGLPLLDRAVDEAIAQVQALSTGGEQSDPDVPLSDHSTAEATAVRQEALSF